MRISPIRFEMINYRISTTRCDIKYSEAMTMTTVACDRGLNFNDFPYRQKYASTTIISVIGSVCLYVYLQVNNGR